MFVYISTNTFFILHFILCLENVNQVRGLLEMHLAEGVKLQMCNLLHHLLDLQLRHRIESLIAYCDDYVCELQNVREVLFFLDIMKYIINIHKSVSSAFLTCFHDFF